MCWFSLFVCLILCTGIGIWHQSRWLPWVRLIEIIIFLFRKKTNDEPIIVEYKRFYLFFWSWVDSFVHGRLPYDRIKQDFQLRRLLLSIPQRKIVSSLQVTTFRTKNLFHFPLLLLKKLMLMVTCWWIGRYLRIRTWSTQRKR